MVTDGSTEGDLVPAENQIAQDTQDWVDTGIVEDDNQVVIAQVVAPETIQVDFDLTIPDPIEDDPSTEQVAAAEQRTKSREERGKAAETGKKRGASTAGLTDEGPPLKTFCLTRGDSDHPDWFSFQYTGDWYLVRDQEAACHLWRNITLPGARAFPDPDELVFKEDYQKFAWSSLQVLILYATSAFLSLYI